MNEDILNTRFQNQIDMFRFDNRFTIDYDLVTFNRNNFTSIFINEILSPSLQHTSCQLTTDNFLQVGFINLNVFSQIKDFEDVFIIFKAYSSQQCSYRQFLLTIDVSIHHVVNIRSKFYPRTFKRNDTS